MIELPDFSKKWEYENNFYLTCDSSRIGKMLVHYELYKMVAGLEGDVVECGVFKGVSLARFATYRELAGRARDQRIIGFDVFGRFPDTAFEGDKSLRQRFVDTAGEQSIGAGQLREVLRQKSLDHGVELVEGDVCQTVPEYVARNPGLKISLLNLDTDIYEPAVVVLKYLYPLIVPGGILMTDDYNSFPGETKAVNDYFGDNLHIEQLPFSKSPAFIRKA